MKVTKEQPAPPLPEPQIQITLTLEEAKCLRTDLGYIIYNSTSDMLYAFQKMLRGATT